MTKLERFEKYVRKWQKKFSLDNYRIYVLQGDFTHSAAQVRIDNSQVMAHVELGKDCEAEYLEWAAFHEVSHILLSVISDVHKSPRFFSDEVVNSKEHEIINRLERLLLGVEK